MSGLVQFRCHFLDGSTVEVSAPNAAIARSEARSRSLAPPSPRQKEATMPDELDATLRELDRHFRHPTKGLEALRKLVAINAAASLEKNVSALIDELAEAADRAADDIGGSRGHREIFNEILAARGIAPQMPDDVKLLP
ncbi:MAG: hypothetical protein KDJ43_08310, partial [Rhizobiaceae bacterium]|nr:hypothetical protein [Rhizobiaceae bacterium]MCB1466434.1 hypothetical protein [Rhizobiaceae bacterium]